MNYNAAPKKTEEDLSIAVLKWRDLQDMLLYEKSKMHNVLPSYIRMGTVKNARCVCMSICLYLKEKQHWIN